MAGLPESMAISRFQKGTGLLGDRIPGLFISQRSLRAFDSPEKSPKIG
jgi:hypothetical protein